MNEQGGLGKKRLIMSLYELHTGTVHGIFLGDV